MPRATARAEAARRLGKSQEGGPEAAAPTPPAPGIAARGEADRRQMAHAGEGDWPRLRGAPAAGLPLLGEGGERPPARPPGLSGGLETSQDRAQPEAGERWEGGQKERAVGKGLLEERRGHRAGSTG